MLLDGANLVEGSVNTNIVMPNLTTAQKNALTSPDAGELIFDTDLGKLQVYSGTAWGDVAAAVDISGKLDVTQKGVANGVAPLDGDAKISQIYLPSYVDDILEYANVAAFPATGEAGKIYVSQAVNLTYRWTGSAYVEVSSAGGSPVASGVGFTATGGIAATNVQDAIAEMDTEKDTKKVTMSNKTAAYTLVAADAGSQINITTGGVTLNNGVLATGDCVAMYNQSASAQNFAYSGITVYKNGTSTAATSPLSVPARTVISVVMVSSSEALVTGL